MIRNLTLVVSGLVLLACTPAEQPAESAGDAIDLIVAGDYVVTMDQGLTVIENGAVAVDDGVIIAVGPAEEIRSQHTALETLPGGGRVVMPGLVNGHQHAAIHLQVEKDPGLLAAGRELAEVAHQVLGRAGFRRMDRHHQRRNVTEHW